MKWLWVLLVLTPTYADGQVHGGMTCEQLRENAQNFHPANPQEAFNNAFPTPQDKAWAHACLGETTKLGKTPKAPKTKSPKGLHVEHISADTPDFIPVPIAAPVHEYPPGLELEGKVTVAETPPDNPSAPVVAPPPAPAPPVPVVPPAPPPPAPAPAPVVAPPSPSPSPSPSPPPPAPVVTPAPSHGLSPGFGGIFSNSGDKPISLPWPPTLENPMSFLLPLFAIIGVMVFTYFVGKYGVVPVYQKMASWGHSSATAISSLEARITALESKSVATPPAPHVTPPAPPAPPVVTPPPETVAPHT